MPAQYRAALATTILQHGIKANRATLETCAGYSHEQGLTSRVLKLEELFAANSLGS